MTETLDLSKLEVRVAWHTDLWMEIKNSAMFTEHKRSEVYPTREWKRSMLMCEHSPIRDGVLTIEILGLPTYVMGHLVRHAIGLTPYACTFRDDRWEVETTPDRNTPSGLRIRANFQALINVSRRRCCFKADPQTVRIWNMVLDKVSKVEPEVGQHCVPECIYRGGCTERKSCGYWKCFREKYQDSFDLLDIHTRYDVYNANERRGK